MKRNILLIGILLVIGSSSRAGEAPDEDRAPIRLHPGNPHYFEFRGKPTVLITSTEHYGAILNGDFDAIPYLNELRARGFNLTRTFSGTYREVPGAFKIRKNTLAPSPEKYIAPWPRSETPGAGDGLKKFDLRRWNAAYFERLKAFVAAASERGIVVEFTLFCPFYEENLWRVNPMNARNNVNGVGDLPRNEAYTGKHRDLQEVQEAFVRKVVRELNGFDNLYFEICNEPYFGGVTLDWQARIAAVIAETEKGLPRRHLIAQNIANEKAKIDRPNPAVSIFNFHYAAPPATVGMNYGLNKVIGDDETGFRGTQDRPYRIEAWDFLIAGGALFDNLDYSFTTDRENGTDPVVEPTPGGGGPVYRGQLQVLKRFIEGFDFIKMAPDAEVIAGVVPSNTTARALSEPGRAYALYIHGGHRVALSLRLPAGRYRAEWLDPLSGQVAHAQEIEGRGEPVEVASPEYRDDVALRIRRLASRD